MSYSFEHGIDHSGHDGIFPLLVVGGPVTNEDFRERDLSSIRGVIVSQRGLPKGTRWKDLNLPLLFAGLPPIEYFQAEFDGPVRLADLGPQPALKILLVDCPTASAKDALTFPKVERVRARWTDDCTARLLGASVLELRLLRSKMENLIPLCHLQGLKSLNLNFGRNFAGLSGLENMKNLRSLGIFDCPSLTGLNLPSAALGLHELRAGGVRNFSHLEDLMKIPTLRKLTLLDCASEIFMPLALKTGGIDLDVGSSKITWIESPEE